MIVAMIMGGHIESTDHADFSSLAAASGSSGSGRPIIVWYRKTMKDVIPSMSEFQLTKIFSAAHATLELIHHMEFQG